MKRCLLALAVLSSLDVTLSAQAQHTTAENAKPPILSGGTFKLLTWNLHLLPAIVPFKHQKRRARGIAYVLSNTQYDVIVLEEAFHRRARNLIWKAVKTVYPYQFRAPRGGFLKYNCGVWIVSRLAIKDRQAIGYSKCCRGTADCRARKGALFAEVEKEGRQFQVIGTHLQAIEGEKYQEVREFQLSEIRNRLILTNKKNAVPFIVTGDMNISMAKTDDYQKMLNILGVTDGPLSGDYRFTSDHATNDLYPSEHADGKVIDYVLMNNMGAPIRSVNRTVKIFRKKWRNKNQDLSDHFAVEAEIAF